MIKAVALHDGFKFWLNCETFWLFCAMPSSGLSLMMRFTLINGYSRGFAMRLDSSTFPVVKIVFDAPNEGGPEDAFLTFESLLARQQSFVLLHEKSVDENNHEHSHEERKHASIWMKKNKQALRTYVKGMIQVEPSAAQRLALKPFAAMFGKAWGYPLLVVESRESAWALARDVLDERVSDVAHF